MEEYTAKDRIRDFIEDMAKAIVFIIFMGWCLFAVWYWEPVINAAIKTMMK